MHRPLRGGIDTRFSSCAAVPCFPPDGRGRQHGELQAPSITLNLGTRRVRCSRYCCRCCCCMLALGQFPCISDLAMEYLVCTSLTLTELPLGTAPMSCSSTRISSGYLATKNLPTLPTYLSPYLPTRPHHEEQEEEAVNGMSELYISPPGQGAREWMHAAHLLRLSVSFQCGLPEMACH